MFCRGRPILFSLLKKKPVVFVGFAIITFILVSLQYYSLANSPANEQSNAQYSRLRRFLSLSISSDEYSPNQNNNSVQSSEQIEVPTHVLESTHRPNTVLKLIPESISNQKTQMPPEKVPRCSCSLEVPRILLITYFRSGSSFLGDLLQQSCPTFYSFEPLHFMTEGVRIPDSMSSEAFSLLGHMMQCSFPEISFYVKWALKPDNRFLFKWNRFLWSRCSMRPVSCFNAAFIKQVCNNADVQLIKTTRLHMRNVRPFLQTLDHSILNSLKVVYLVRDPRGIYNSRKNLLWCSNRTCADPETICNEISEDLIEFSKLKSQLPEQVFMVRYEDLSISPEKTTTRLLQQLQLPFSKQVQRFLRSHTMVDPHSLGSEMENPYSTRRDSVSTAVDWFNRLSLHEIQIMQTACHSVIKELQYHYITANESKTQLDSLRLAEEIRSNLNFNMDSFQTLSRYPGRS